MFWWAKMGVTEAVEIQSPDIEGGVSQRVAPRPSVKAMRDRERGREGCAVHIKYGAARIERRALGRQVAQEEQCVLARPRNPEMLLVRIEAGRSRKVGHAEPAQSCRLVL